jgi:uncharacterized protein (DUF2267 family)
MMERRREESAMRLTKRLVQATGLAAGVVGVVAATAPESPLGRQARRLRDRLARDVRYAVSSAPGILYRLAGRQPDPNVPDDVLGDRIRSQIGPLEKRLDVPRVHVMVDERVAILHGEVPDEHSAHALEHAVMQVSGVVGVESHLHPGLVAGDTRPSEGAAAPPPASDALRALTDAARDAGARHPRSALHAVLCGFMDRLPADEALQVLAHLPADVRELAGPPRRHGEPAPRLRTVPQLVAAVTTEGGIESRQAEQITRAVVATLRGLVPEEAHDVAAVLPAELRELWEASARPASPTRD